ncbi:MAG: sulfite exporter TauE/SafE family protein [Pedosphaera sp.]|nr:sulfite exporter TauE/SafE family protein [Pedosphaera sp.]
MNWPFLAAALVLAGFVQGLTGFGFGLVSMSLLPLVISIKQAAAFSTVFSLLATFSIFFRHYREYNWRHGFVFLASVCVGVPAGVFFLEKMPEAVLIKILGAMMLLFAAREFLFNAQPKTIPSWLTVPLGMFSGTLSGAFNLGGIPSAAYAYAHPWSRGQIMAFLQVMITLSCALRIGFYGKFGYFRDIPLGYAALLALPISLALWLGHVALAKVQPKHMRAGVFAFIGAAGVYYLFWH